jgi:hypothetical protein
MKLFLFLTNVLVGLLIILKIEDLGILSAVSLIGTVPILLTIIICLTLVVGTCKNNTNRKFLVYGLLAGLCLTVFSFFMTIYLFDKADFNKEITYFEKLLSAFSIIYALLFPISTFILNFKGLVKK